MPGERKTEAEKGRRAMRRAMRRTIRRTEAAETAEEYAVGAYMPDHGMVFENSSNLNDSDLSGLKSESRNLSSFVLHWLIVGILLRLFMPI